MAVESKMRLRRPVHQVAIALAQEHPQERAELFRIRCGQVLLKDLLGEKGLDVVATRSMERAAPGAAKASS